MKRKQKVKPTTKKNKLMGQISKTVFPEYAKENQEQTTAVENPETKKED